MPRLLVRSPGSQGLTLELKSGAYRIGRGLGNDFQIDHPSVSVAHCELTLVRGSLLVRDLGSTNGTFIDHQRIAEGTLLFGQILQVGIVELVLAEPLRVSRAGFELSGASAAGTNSWRGCRTHPDLEAMFTCPHCQHDLCAACARGLARMDGSKIRLCPDCGNECEEIRAMPAIQEATGLAAGNGESVLRAGLWPHLAEWFKGKVLQGLLYQRRKLLEAQELAARQAFEFDQRLAAVQTEMHDRIKEYEQRIVELEDELAAAELEKRELIRNQIVLIKRALAEEREKEQVSTGQARSFACGRSSNGAVRPTP
jgi:pSer/pThr/pTyr-binding forkhead associated (FHA) protein/flagellar biosynthesis/type III secretory pathway chaperone